MANKVTGWQDTVLTDEQARDLPCPNTYCNTYKTNYTCKACIQAKATWEVAYKAGQKSGRQEVVDIVIKAIIDEPEYPEEMPDALWDLMKNDKDAVSNSLRNTVKLTKRGILERLQTQFPTHDIRSFIPNWSSYVKGE
jgi:hypothetical protein